MEQKSIKSMNPALARKMFWFSIMALFLSFSAWGLNLALLAYNLLTTDMIWPIATIIFCLIWLAIYFIQRIIMAPIGMRLAVRVTEMQFDAIEEMGNEIIKRIDTMDYLRKKEEETADE